MIPTSWDVAKGVAAELQGQTWTPAPSQIKAKFRHIFDPAKAGPALLITVIPDRLLGIECASRTDDTHTPAIIIGVQKKLTTLGDAEDEDAGTLLALMTSIGGFLSRRRLASVPTARRKEIDIPSLWDPAQKEQLHVFTAFLRVTYTITIPSPRLEN